MQKKLIALAVAGLASTGAFAQSNVTIYGLLQPSYDFVSVDPANGESNDITNMAYNNSRIGFKGEEAIGNGLKAVFQIESKVDLTDRGDDAGGLADRDSWVGLSSAAGTLTFGNHQTAYVRSSASYDKFADTIGDYNNIMGVYGAGFDGADFDGASNDFNRRVRKSAYYTSPSFSGFQITGSYALKGQLESNDGSHSEDIYAIAGTYTNGGLNALLAYENQNGDVKAKGWKAGASYKFGFGTTLSAIYENLKMNDDFDVDHWVLGASHSFGAVEVMAQYMNADDNSVGSNTNDGADAWALGASYNFSKRTSVMAVYAEVDNDANGQYFMDAGYHGADDGTGAVVGGSDISGFSVRIKHSF